MTTNILFNFVRRKNTKVSMRKRLLIFIIPLLVFISCDSGYTIEANIKGLSGGRVTLFYLDKNKTSKILNTATADGEKIILKGDIGEPKIGYLRIDDTGESIDLIIERGHIRIKAYKDSIFGSSIVGTKNNVDMATYKRKVATYNRKIELARINLDRSNDTDLVKAQQDYDEVYKKAQEKILEYSFQFVDQHRDSFISLLILDIMKDNPDADLTRMKSCFSNITPSLMQSEYANQYLKDLKE